MWKRDHTLQAATARVSLGDLEQMDTFVKKIQAMPALATQPKPAVFSPKLTANGFPSKPISWKDFQRKYLRREDGFKYEWVGGTIEKTIRSMDKTQLYLLYNLQVFFRQLLKEGKAHGDLISEPDLFFLENHRRPDICWLTDEQIYKLADPEVYEVPAFIIEVISSNDQINTIKKKMVNYRDAGVKAVWHIFPKYRQVDVYSGKNLEDMTVCSGEKICSAAPALPAFKLPANAIFYRPDQPA